jgi:hypothetical protein
MCNTQVVPIVISAIADPRPELSQINKSAIEAGILFVRSGFRRKA